MSLLAFEACKSLPAALLVWMHPLVLAAPVVIAGLSYFQAIKGRDLSTGLQRYLTEHSALPPYDGWPGAGNIMLAAMDVSIVSLSATVVSQSFAFQELCITVICAVVMVFVALFLVPLTAQGIGMTPLLSLAFTTRSVTAAIGITISRMVHSNMSIAGCIIVLTGVMGPLLGPVLLRLARVSKDDHLTIGVTMGSISHGIATAYLYNTNRPAAAMASLAFTLSAVVAVITASIPPLATAARVTAGYSP
ncbi:CidB/LrgB family [Radiomyces spectabilis]|uniref:CidB/LrgB family n=1 Tax=Radiomyces spectabilis TaxID=64574 RepID=UPI002220527E|nr:CidB/LrgB family [Radiomyces spectabilis]KAI8373035.1 CidB/LrgB family [Radiomyces spectabilis]